MHSSQSLPRSAFAALCAFALAASMALPMIGAAPSFAAENDESTAESSEESAQSAADATEGDNEASSAIAASEAEGKTYAADEAAATYSVTIGTQAPLSVNAGDTVVLPTLGNTMFNAGYWTSNVEVPVTFVGWYLTVPEDSEWFGVAPDGVNCKEKNPTYTGFVGGVDDRCINANARFGVKADYELSDFKDKFIFYSGGESVTVNENMRMFALYTYETSLVTEGNYFMGINVAENAGPIHRATGSPMLGHDMELGAYASVRHPDFVFKGIYLGENGKPTNVPYPVGEPVAADHEKWEVYVRSESLPVAGSTGILVSGILSGRNVPLYSDTSIKADKIDSGADYDTLVSAMGSGDLAGVFGVDLIVDGSTVHDGFGEITLSFPVGEGNDGKGYTVHHLHKDGSLTSEQVKAEGDAVTITVTDLSSFALEADEATSAKPLDTSSVGSSGSTVLAQTGDSLFGFAVAGIAVAALGAAAFAGYRARKLGQQ